MKYPFINRPAVRPTDRAMFVIPLAAERYELETTMAT